MKIILNIMCLLFLINTFFTDAVAVAEDLVETNLNRLKAINACVRCYMGGVNLQGAILHRTNLKQVKLIGAGLRWAYFSGVNLGRANLSSANLRDAWLSETNLHGVNLKKAYLSEGNLS